MQSALGVGLELVDQFKLPTMRSAVVSLTTSRAFCVVQPFQACSHSSAAAVRHVRVSHGVTRRETDVHPGGGHALQRLPLELGLGALGSVCDQAARCSSRARRLERLQDGRRIERVRSEETLSPRFWPSPGQIGRPRRRSRQPGTPPRGRRGWRTQPATPRALRCCRSRRGRDS